MLKIKIKSFRVIYSIADMSMSMSIESIQILKCCCPLQSLWDIFFRIIRIFNHSKYQIINMYFNAWTIILRLSIISSINFGYKTCAVFWRFYSILKLKLLKITIILQLELNFKIITEQFDEVLIIKLNKLHFQIYFKWK